ncbi:Cell division inhibitor [Cyanobacterium sp. HL-69]|uniref:thiol-disulfide oxidoreductase DCC family protein n=1 Tax=Cyanobacterium sp. HL-69 TaxID=2054282 RepID=UPI000CA3F02E|nr:Cell division inhibitor [Cyanobacterium sp. HL-69]
MSNNNPSYEIKLLYDGECPFCVKEVNFLKKKDNGRGKVAFVDISSPDYSPEANQNIDYATAMGKIHAILADGTIITNVEVFRRVYEILGMGWIYAITKIPVIGWLADQIYGIWAKYRLQLSGRPNLAKVIREKDNAFCSVNK